MERDFWTSEERGVLRRLVPHWLCEPSFRLARRELYEVGAETRRQRRALRDDRTSARVRG